MKVYLVFKGEYSDYTCMAVFDNKEQAEQYVKILEKEDYSCIEEHEVNEIKPQNMEYRTVYEAVISKDDGSIYNYIYKNTLVDVSNRTKIENYNKCIIVNSIVSKEHARKVAIEQYQIYTQQKLENGEV